MKTNYEEENDAYGFPTWIFSCEYFFVLVQSPTFLFSTFTFSVCSRVMAMADVFTDFLQLYQFTVGIEKPGCLSPDGSYGCKRRVMVNPINRSAAFLTSRNTDSTSAYLPREPYWFTITALAIYLPVLQCVLQLRIEQIIFRYCYHNFSLKSRISMDTLPNWMCKHAVSPPSCQQIRTVKPSYACLLKVLLFPALPVLISIRQVRQIILLVKLEWYRQKMKRSLVSEPSPLNERICRTCADVFCCFASGNDSSDSVLPGIIHSALTSEDFQPPESTKLYEELTLLSEDRLDEAVLEATPQAILNLSLIFQYGGNFSQASLFCSFGSLVMSAAQYTEHKLKKNPVKRELTAVGDIVAFLATFPSVLSRCTMLGILFSIQSFVAKALGFTFIIMSTLFGMAFEYHHLAADGKKKNVNLFMHLFVRGYTSVFTLMEYRTKRFNVDHWEDEADDEMKKGISKEPKHRLIHQLVYLVVNSYINLTFIGCWYFLLCENICFVDGLFLPKLDEPRFPLLILISSGGPISIVFTMIIRNPTIKRLVTELGMKATGALHYHVVSILTTGNHERINTLVERLTPCSEQEILRIDEMQDPSIDKSVLWHTLHHHTNDARMLLAFRDVMNLGFPVYEDCLRSLSDVITRLFKSKRYDILHECLPDVLPVLDNLGMDALHDNVRDVISSGDLPTVALLSEILNIQMRGGGRRSSSWRRKSYVR